MYQPLLLCATWIIFSITFYYFYYVNKETTKPNFNAHVKKLTYNAPEDFENFDNISGTPDGCYIVPNYVHFIRFSAKKFTFVDAVCVLAAFKNQRPEKIFFHTDVPNFSGKYWEKLLEEPGLKEIIEVQLIKVPNLIFGQPIAAGWRLFHGGDVARLKILMKYGGIYLDNDSYIVRNLDVFRKFEMTLGWKEGGNISNQVIVAHKNARFLREWLMTYFDNYKSDSWFYNAGIRPTQEVLLKRPELIHRESKYFAVYHGMVPLLYTQRSSKWKDHYAIHLLIHHQYMIGKKNITATATYPTVFNEKNIKYYPITFRDMVADVYNIE